MHRLLILLGLALLVGAIGVLGFLVTRSEGAEPRAVAPSPGAGPASEPEGRTELEVPPPVPVAQKGRDGAKPGDAPVSSDAEAAPPHPGGGGATAAAPPPRPTTPEAPEPGAAAPDSTYRGPGDSPPARPGATGSVRGVVRFEGQPPAPRQLEIPPETLTACGAGVDTSDRSLLLADSGGIANVVVTVLVAGKSAIPATAPVVIRQQKCRYEPHVTLVPAGSDVQFANADGTTAMFHTHPHGNPTTNVVIPPGGTAATAHYARADTIEITSDCCPWMQAWVVVTDAPFHALTQSDGGFEFRGLPPGPLQLSLWHEKLGEKKVRVDVVAGQVTELDLTFD